jgi:AraC-like DNA-binding protein
VYRETAPPPALRGLVECAWVSSGGPGTRVLPDGCMDLLLAPTGSLSVAGPDTHAFVTPPSPTWTAGVRFRPGVLPRLLGVPAVELRNRRAPLDALGVPKAVSATRDALGVAQHVAPILDARRLLAAVARLAESAVERRETAPWRLPALAHVTDRLAAGARVEDLADELGWSARSLTRQCTAVYGYGPSVLRRVLRFRAASALLHAGTAPAEVAARTGYADQPHLTREFRALAGVTPATLNPDPRPLP